VVKLLLLLLLAALPACAEVVRIDWDASPSPFFGYHIYQGPAARFYTNMVDVGPVLTYTANLKPGIYHFAVTAYTTEESEFSNDLMVTVGTVTIGTNQTNVVTIFVPIRSATNAAGPWKLLTNLQITTLAYEPKRYYQVGPIWASNVTPRPVSQPSGRILVRTNVVPPPLPPR